MGKGAQKFIFQGLDWTIYATWLTFLGGGSIKKSKGKKKKNRERWKVEGPPKSEWVLTVLLQEPTKGDFSEFRLAMLVLVMSKLNAYKTWVDHNLIWT